MKAEERQSERRRRKENSITENFASLRCRSEKKWLKKNAEESETAKRSYENANCRRRKLVTISKYLAMKATEESESFFSSSQLLHLEASAEEEMKM